MDMQELQRLNNEFRYPAFNGLIAEIRLFFGKGSSESKRSILKENLSYHKPPVQGSYH